MEDRKDSVVSGIKNRSNYAAKNESNRELGLRKRWLELLEKMLNVDKDFYQVAICDIASGKVWAEKGGFSLFVSNEAEENFESRNEETILSESLIISLLF